MSIHADVQAVIDGILAGKILETFETYYADDIVMSENGAEDRIGKDVNREFEKGFVTAMDFYDVQVGDVIIDGHKAAVEWTFVMGPKGTGEKFTQRQVAVQTWKDGKIVREVFYYNKG